MHVIALSLNSFKDLSPIQFTLSRNIKSKKILYVDVEQCTVLLYRVAKNSSAVVVLWLLLIMARECHVVCVCTCTRWWDSCQTTRHDFSTKKILNKFHFFLFYHIAFIVCYEVCYVMQRVKRWATSFSSSSFRLDFQIVIHDR